MNPTTRRRLVGGAAALMLIGATFLSTAGSALAGETRDVNITMSSFTGVSAGGVSKTDITITNVSGHTLSNAHFVVGLDQVPPQSGATVVAAFGPDSGLCSAVPATTLDCALGNIGAKASQATRKLSVAFSFAGSAATTTPYTISTEVKVSETGSDVGSNTNYRTTSQSLTVGLASCNSAATFVPPKQAGSINPTDGTNCSADHQRSFLGFSSGANPDGTLANVDDSSPATGCGNKTCIGNGVSAIVNDGATLKPYLLWQIFYANDVLANNNPKLVEFLHVTPSGTILIPAVNKGVCKTDTSFNCQQPYVISADGSGVTFFIRTDTNGVIKGR